MKIYTKTGDDGSTGLYGGARVPKNDPRVEVYGTIDELNSAIGVARSLGLDAFLDSSLFRIQEDLFVFGAELACVPEKRSTLPMALLQNVDVARLESLIDSAESRLSPLENFILPGGTTGAAQLHFCRTVCRRAERELLGLQGLRNELLIYLNRLSDLLFVFARFENHTKGAKDVPWAPRHAG